MSALWYRVNTANPEGFVQGLRPRNRQYFTYAELIDRMGGSCYWMEARGLPEGHVVIVQCGAACELLRQSSNSGYIDGPDSYKTDNDTLVNQKISSMLQHTVYGDAVVCPLRLM
jgi:hypothetical protein